ncbi:hypothetical protein VIMS_01414 [Mycobacterium marinum]|nr:hypothetical protein VIMS_01414 [Mycobacterium marinum]
MNFGHYPDTVAQVVAVEPDDTLRPVAASDVVNFAHAAAVIYYVST